MIQWQPLTVHFVGQHCIGVYGLGQGQAAFVGHFRGIAHGFIGSVVRSLKHYLHCRGLDASLGQNVSQRYSGPLGIAHNAVALDHLHYRTGPSGPGPIVRDRTVAATFESNLEALLGHCQNIVKRKA